ncbi:glucose sorbosone dehydrogenase [Flammeovirgaceae bacterium 311]|nr:glucose sorbosone dehydrogenase [Flammeovirgaceae bacterium 311]
MLIAPSHAQDNEGEEPVTATIEGHVFKPVKRKATDERVAQLKVPAGFRIQKFAEDLGNTRMMAINTDGTLYVTRREQGDVLMLKDTNGDGKADVKQTVAKQEDMHGITIHEGKVYLATVKQLYVTDIKQDGMLGELQKIGEELPDGGQHPNRTLRFGPDGKLYISIGSTCNACEETNPEHATLLQANADGTNRKVYAKGLRNTFGFDWHPQSRQLWGMDHGIDWLGDEAQREELNLIEEGEDYGWPYVYEDGKSVPHRSPDDKSHSEKAAESKFPVLTHDAHSSGMGMLFYTGTQFPAEYRNNAFVVFRGSWNRSNPVGYKLARVKYDANGQPTAFEDFLTGFLIEEGRAHIGRPVSVAQHPDGSLFLCDDSNGMINRISYTTGIQQGQKRRKN